jgi:hypothetical protein
MASPCTHATAICVDIQIDAASLSRTRRDLRRLFRGLEEMKDIRNPLQDKFPWYFTARGSGLSDPKFERS